MIEAVFTFGLVTILFEFILLSMIPPRQRLRILGSEVASNAMHVFFLGLNLAIHWGTVVGTMSAILAFVSSIATVNVARKVFGTIRGRQYKVGLVKYSIEELK